MTMVIITTTPIGAVLVHHHLRHLDHIIQVTTPVVDITLADIMVINDD